MKIVKKYVVVLLIFTAIFLVGCFQEILDGDKNSDNTSSDNKVFYDITFMVDNEIYQTEKIILGGQVVKPKNPSKENYIFLHWCKDSNCKTEYDFSNMVYKNLTLYASFTIDASTITSEITKNYIRGVFTIKVTSSKTIYEKWDIFKLGGTTYKSGSQGSGVCFRHNNGTYYVLTNCHVAKKESGYTSVSYVVEDYRGKTYTAYLYKNSNKSSSAISADYDLACLYFKSSEEYPVFSISSDDPVVNDDVISIGTPGGQTNAVAFGKVLRYSQIDLDNTEEYLSNVTFSVIVHNAFTDRGSSGGPLIDAYYNIIGINYAGVEDNSYGSSIPPSRIKEFLNTFVYD